ncbi:hypothetical protein JKP88DRAFT_353688 [Tribonema minus]|uniref:Ion transport domain-containing protein n=1 Tax=Tribonema minus TaxID=303371 RepID=A0A836CJB1_9STRA|nr:hypothetical protein JKP88DRAFT_353688 [Tribonema minus]
MAVDSADAAIPAVLEPMPPPLVNEEGFAFYTPARHSAPTATMNAAADAIVDISAELAERRTRWRYLAEKADWLLGSTSHARDDAAAARKCQPQDPAVDRYEAASYYIKWVRGGRVRAGSHNSSGGWADFAHCMLVPAPWEGALPPGPLSRDAMHGRKIIAHIHTQRQLSAVRLARARPIILIFNVLCFFQLLLPLIEMPMGWECREGAVRSIQDGGVLCELDGDSLAWFVGWRPTMLGSSWLELPICAFFLFEIALLFMIRDRCSGRPFYHTNVWATMRLACVWLQLVDILIFLWGRYTYEGTALSMEFFRRARAGCSRAPRLADAPALRSARRSGQQRSGAAAKCALKQERVAAVRKRGQYSRALTFFIYITNHQYLRLFVKGLWHVLPRLMPVATAAAFVVCLYGYVGYLAFNHTRAQPDALRELDLFRTLPGAMLTALRMFTSVVFVLDLEFLYRRSPGIRIYCATYALLAAVLLCALVTAVANKLFQQQSLDAYRLVIRQRARALSMAFDCLRGANIGSSDGSSGGGGAAEDGGGKSPVPNGGGKGGGGSTGHARGGSGSSGVPAVVGGAEVTADDWVALMAHLRPDLSGRGCRLLFNTVGEGCGGGDLGPTRCDRAQFFELCALVQAHIEGGAEDWRAPLRGSASSMPQPQRRNGGGGGGGAEGGCCAALARRCGSTVRALRRRVRRYVRWTVATPFNNWWGLTHADDIHVRRAVNNVASVVHAVLLAVQGTVLPGEQDPAGNTAFEGRELHMALLEYTLVVYFWADAAAVLWAGGAARALSDAYWCLGVALNAVATAWVAGAWPEGRDRAYYVAMAPRALGLWRVVHQLQGTRSDVAERLARVLPTLLRSTSVLLAFVYSSALCAYGMLWHT